MKLSLSLPFHQDPASGERPRGDGAAPAQEMDADLELELRARAEHLRVICKSSWVVLLANLSGGAAVVGGLWSVAPQDRLLIWVAVLTLLTTVRWFQGRRLARRPSDLAGLGRQEALVIAGTLASGLIWASAALLFFLPDQGGYGLFLALVLVAMTAMSAMLLSFHRFAFPVFCTPVVASLAYQLALGQDPAQTATALVIPVWYALLLLLSRQIYRVSNEAIITSLVRQRHALMDQLTAVPNRRAFEEFLEREWVRGIRSGGPISLILSDVDEFKRYNDQYGHAVGDAILRSVAGVFLQAARRRTDLAARIGGDEFAIIAPETDRAGAAAIVRRIEESRVRLAQGSFEVWSFPTFSYGFCTVTPSDSGSVFELFEAADAALYESKLAGRNHVAECPRW